MKTFPYLILFITALFFIGCTSTGNKKTILPSLNGMIFDEDNKPVADATILSSASKRPVTSDIHGHFTIENLKSGDAISLTANKESYEQETISFQYTDPTQILYIRMVSAEQLLNLAEQSLALQKWETAGKYLDRSRAIGGNHSHILYLEAIIDYQNKSYATAEQKLREILDKGTINPYIYLFLADIYQYQLVDIEKAINAMETAQRLQHDPDVEERITLLRKKILEK